MLLYIIRHGQTDHNVAGIIQGQLDTPLNDHGRQEASLVARRLATESFKEVWSSSLSRASETAEIIATSQPESSGVKIQTNPGLMERGLGSLEGRRRLAGEGLPPDVESSDTFRKRISTWFEGFLSSHEAGHHSGPICIVSHGAYITTFVSLLLSPQYFDFKRGDGLDIRRNCYNTSIMLVDCTYHPEETKWRGTVLSFGDVDHLAELTNESHRSDSRLADDLKG